MAAVASLFNRARGNATSHKWVGYCITPWADVEEHLFEICGKALACAKERAAIIYYKTPTVDARLSLTDELARSVLPKPKRKSGDHPHADVTTWAELRNRIRSNLETRNRIAHDPVHKREITVPLRYAPAFPGTHSLSATVFESNVSQNEMLRGKDDGSKPLFSGDIMAHFFIAKGLANETQNF